MNIPPKYEDVVAQLDAALAREAALREELTKFSEGMRAIAFSLGAGGYNEEVFTADKLIGKVSWGIEYLIDVNYRRLEVSEQRAVVLTEALEGMVEYFPEGHSDGECFSVERAKAALKPAEGEGS